MYFKNLCALVFLSLATLAWGADPTLETIDTPPPEEVSPAIREALGGPGLKVLSGDKVVMELWLRSEVPIEEQARKDLGVSFGNLQEGTLIGVIRLPEEWSDYKNNPIAAGVYTLRYGIQPADGNHMGVSQYRDFLIFLPASADSELESSFGRDGMIMQSYASTGKAHPGNMGVFPLYEEAPEPKMIRNELDQWTLALELGAVKMGLVVEGHGELEGY